MMFALSCITAYANESNSDSITTNVFFNKGVLFVDTIAVEDESSIYLQIIEQIRNKAVNGSASHSLFLAKFLKSKEDAVGSWNLEKTYRDSLQAHYIKWFELAANQGSPEAMCELGKYYEGKDRYAESYDVANLDKAIELLSKSSELGYTKAAYWLGCIYREKKIPLSGNRYIKNSYHNDRIAADWYLKGAEKNDYDCVYELAWIYYYGLGHVKKDKRKHIEYLTKSAELNNPFALEQLSEYYSKGKYVKKDSEKAAELQKQILTFRNKK